MLAVNSNDMLAANSIGGLAATRLATRRCRDSGSGSPEHGRDGVVRTWTQEGRLIKSFAAHDTSVRRIVKTGSFAVTVGSTDGRLKVWDWEKEGEPEWLFDLLEKPAYMVSLATTAYGKLAVASWDDKESWEAKIAPQRIQAWGLDTIQQLASQQKAKAALH